MSNPFRSDSPAYYEALRGDLRSFRNLYVPYLNETVQRVYSGESVDRDDRRSELLRAAVRAHRAVGVAGVQLAWLPPPVFRNSTPPLEGLASVAFAHENEAYRGFSAMNIPKPFEFVLDAVDQADALLEVREREVRRRRRQPTYWIDRVLRAVLGAPAYLASTVFRFDLNELSSNQGRVLWWLALLADVAGVFAVGRMLNWW